MATCIEIAKIIFTYTEMNSQQVSGHAFKGSKVSCVCPQYQGNIIIMIQTNAWIKKRMHNLIKIELLVKEIQVVMTRNNDLYGVKCLSGELCC